jgi:hypothetical protein
VSSPDGGPARRLATALRRPLRGARNAADRIYATNRDVEALRGDIQELRAAVQALNHDLWELRGVVQGSHGEVLERIERRQAELIGVLERHHADELGTLAGQHDEAREMLQLLSDREPAERQALWRARETPLYAQAFEEPEPLVTITIATYTNLELLLERALPSVLGQSYERIEVVIVGDAAAPEVGTAIRGLGDPRVRYSNLTHRGPYPAEPERLWCVAGGPAQNEAMRLARGRWIAPMDDDDANTPDRVEKLLDAARQRDLEFCYGRVRKHSPDGSSELLCEFPPRHAAVNLSASIQHADLRFFTSELADATFGIVGDWARVRRMMRVGVRIGMIDDVLVDYYPGTLWARR